MCIIGMGWRHLNRISTKVSSSCIELSGLQVLGVICTPTHLILVFRGCFILYKLCIHYYRLRLLSRFQTVFCPDFGTETRLSGQKPIPTPLALRTIILPNPPMQHMWLNIGCLPFELSLKSSFVPSLWNQD